MATQMHVVISIRNRDHHELRTRICRHAEEHDPAFCFVVDKTHSHLKNKVEFAFIIW